MSTELLHDLERRWREGWDPDYGHRYVLELVRRGVLSDISPEKLIETLVEGWPMVGEATTQPIAWGARSRIELLGVQQPVWQYSALNALLLRYEGYTYLLRPQPANATRFAGLCASPWPSPESWSDEVRWAWRNRVARSAPWARQLLHMRPAPPKEQPLPHPLEHLLGLDFSPLLARDLRALADANFPIEATRATLALLDLLLRFRGSGTAEFQSSTIYLDSTLHSLPERYQIRIPDAPIGAQHSATEGVRYRAFAQRVEPIDGQSGGYTDSLCGLELRIAPDNTWRFERTVLWSYQNWGIALT